MEAQKKLFFLIILLIYSINVYSQEAFIPEPTLNVVSDFENILSEEEKGILAKNIKEEYNSNSNQLMIITIPTSYLANLTIENYAQQLFDKWQPGQKDLNNGILLIICGSKIDSIGRKLRIHTGYGIEGALPDLLCSKIENELMVPELKKGNYFKALENGTASILNFISKENIGKIPKYKIEVLKSADLVYDPARIFSDNEKEQLEEALNGSFNTKPCLIVTSFSYDNAMDNVYISSRSSYDTILINIAYNPGYFMDSNDSIFKFDPLKKNYYLSYYAFKGEFNLIGNNFYNFQDSIAKSINEAGIFKTVNFFISSAKADYARRWRWSANFFGAMLAISIFVFLVFKITIKLGKNKNKKPKFIKISLGILLIIIILYSSFSLVSFEILYYIIFGNYLDLSAFQVVLMMLLLAILHVFNIIFVYKIDENYFDSKLFIWVGKGGSKGSTYSSSYSSTSYNSSSSSSTSSTYSSTSSSSSSNGGYYGGGGKSGGGGASSNW